MKLDRVKAERQREVLQVLRIGMIDEYPDNGNKRRQFLDDGGRFRRIQVSYT